VPGAEAVHDWQLLKELAQRHDGFIAIGPEEVHQAFEQGAIAVLFVVTGRFPDIEILVPGLASSGLVCRIVTRMTADEDEEAQDSADSAEEFWGKDKGTSWLSLWFPHTLQRCFGHDLVGGPVATCGHPCQAPWNHECQNSCAKCRGHNDTCICGGVVRYYPDVTVACGVWEMNDRGQMRAQQQGGRTNHIVCGICGAEGTVKECAGCYLRICQNCTCSLPHVCPYCQDCCDYFEDRRTGWAG